MECFALESVTAMSKRWVEGVGLLIRGAQVKALRFSQVRNARRVLDMKGRSAAAIIGLPYADLRRGERVDAIVPVQNIRRAQQLITLARRAGRKRADRRVAGSRALQRCCLSRGRAAARAGICFISWA